MPGLDLDPFELLADQVKLPRGTPAMELLREYERTAMTMLEQIKAKVVGDFEETAYDDGTVLVIYGHTPSKYDMCQNTTTAILYFDVGGNLEEVKVC